MHSLGYVHNDIKYENLGLDIDGNIYLFDFDNFSEISKTSCSKLLSSTVCYPPDILVEASISNDDHLIKIANIAQKLVLANTKKAGDEGWLSEDDKRALLDEMDVVAKEITQSTDDKIEDLEFEIESLKESIGK